MLTYARLVLHSDEYTNEYTKSMGAKMKRAEAMSERITNEQLHGLDADERAGMLFYLTGFLGKSSEFQEALTAAYAAQMRMRDRLAARGEG